MPLPHGDSRHGSFPAVGSRANESTPVDIDALVELATEAHRGREASATDLGDVCEQALHKILRGGASAGDAMVALAHVRCDLWLQPDRNMDKPAPDEQEWQAEWL